MPLLLASLLGRPGLAQIATDGSLGPAASLSGPAFQIPAELGRTVGPNLFHSFRTFNVGSRESATFSGPAAIDRVIARVTGGAVSTLDGPVRSVVPTADLFLVNPAGVVFGPNASVDVDGSFAVSTADYLKLGPDGRFDATDPTRDVLTVAEPSAFGFLPASGRTSIAGMSFQGSQVKVSGKNDLRIVAGDIDLSNQATLTTSAGPLTVAAVAAPGEVPLDASTTDDFDALGDVVLSGGSAFETGVAGAPGTFRIRAGQLTIEGDGSRIADHAGGGNSAEGNRIDLRGELRLDRSGSIHVTATDPGAGSELVVNAAAIQVLEGEIGVINAGSAASGALTLQANTIHLGPGGSIDATTLGSGAGAKVEIQAGQVSLAGGSLSTLAMAPEGQTAAGDISVIADHLQLTDGGTIASIGELESDSGKVHLAAKQIVMSEGWLLSHASGAGNGRGIAIEAGDLRLEGGSHISTLVAGSGNSAALGITADTITMTGGSAIGGGTSEGASGMAGPIAIEGRRISLDQHSSIHSASGGPNRAGDITLTASEAMTVGEEASINAMGLEGSGGGGSIILTSMNGRCEILGGSVTTYAMGSSTGGSILVSAKKVLVANEGSLSSSASFGPAGNIEVRADDFSLTSGSLDAESLGDTGGNVRISGLTEDRVGQLNVGGAEGIARITTSSLFFGNAGDVEIFADHLAVLSGGMVLSTSSGFGDSGRIHIDAESALISGDTLTSISSSSGFGDAGNVEITGRTLRIADGAQVSSVALLGGRGGDVSIGAREEVTVDGAYVLAYSAAGDGGKVRLSAAESVVLRNDTTCSARAYGDGGNIDLFGNIVGLEDSDLRADAEEGDGGHIEIQSGFMYQLGDSKIEFDSQNRSAQPGTLSIRSAVDFGASLNPLRADLSAGDEEVREGCARRNPRANSFMIRGKGGMAARPDAFMVLPHGP